MRSSLRKFLGATAATAAVAAAAVGCASSEPTVDATAESTTTTVAVNSGAVVEIASVAGRFSYAPDALEVKIGEAVTWKNIDTTKHTVTADKDQAVDFKSPTMATDSEFVQTFATAGTYGYYCSIHGRDKMSGSITVTE